MTFEMTESGKALAIEHVNALCKNAARIAEEHGFKENTVGEDIALMHSELSEALEDFRGHESPSHTWYEITEKKGPNIEIKQRYTENPDPDGTLKPCGIPSELADCVIRIMHFSHRHGIDLGKAIVEKMAFNETRVYRHGNKKI